jgi:hypothetical protein
VRHILTEKDTVVNSWEKAVSFQRSAVSFKLLKAFKSPCLFNEIGLKSSLR